MLDMENPQNSTNIVDISGGLNHPDLTFYRTLRRPLDHFAERIFVAEGENVVRRLLATNLRIRSLLVTPEWLLQIQNEPRASDPSIIFYRAPKELLAEIVGFNLHQGIMAVVEMPTDPVLEDVLDSVGSTGLIVALDGLVSAENIGVIVRNCAGLGVDLLLAGETSGSPYLRRAVRNSMGTIFSLPVIHIPNLSSCLAMLHTQRGFDVLAADPLGAQSLFETNLTGNVCVVVGNEGNGLSPGVLAVCNRHVSIPMARETDSLNVANATAVILSEALRQRHYAKPR